MSLAHRESWQVLLLIGQILNPLTSQGQPSPEKVWPCPRSHSSRLLPELLGWRHPRVGPLGQPPLCTQETAALSNLGHREEEQVWLRDWQALEAEPGLSLENKL